MEVSFERRIGQGEREGDPGRGLAQSPPPRVVLIPAADFQNKPRRCSCAAEG
jgi:hypothetical protein